MNLLLILGNGFSIDLVKELDKENSIDLHNLFRLGHALKFPEGSRPGFLSYRYCPALWSLGARANMTTTDATNIIQEIITCSNMLSDYMQYSGGDDLKRSKLLQRKPLHIKAYFELIAYIRCLFVEYNKNISDEDIRNIIENKNWGWIKLFKKISSNKDTHVKIVTYNYDILLERIFDIMNIRYSIVGLKDDEEAKFEIIKPHGSINFYCEETPQPFQILDNPEQLEAEVTLEALKVYSHYCPAKRQALTD